MMPTPDADVLEAHEFTPEIPCEGATCREGGAGEHPAQYFLRFNCGHTGFFCRDTSVKIITESRTKIGWHKGCEAIGVQVTSIRRIA